MNIVVDPCMAVFPGTHSDRYDPKYLPWKSSGFYESYDTEER